MQLFANFVPNVRTLADDQEVQERNLQRSRCYINRRRRSRHWRNRSHRVLRSEQVSDSNGEQQSRFPQFWFVMSTEAISSFHSCNELVELVERGMVTLSFSCRKDEKKGIGTKRTTLTTKFKTLSPRTRSSSFTPIANDSFPTTSNLPAKRSKSRLNLSTWTQ